MVGVNCSLSTCIFCLNLIYLENQYLLVNESLHSDHIKFIVVRWGYERVKFGYQLGSTGNQSITI